MRCQYDKLLNKTLCAYMVLKNITGTDSLGPYFELTMDIEYAAGLIFHHSYFKKYYLLGAKSDNFSMHVYIFFEHYIY